MTTIAILSTSTVIFILVWITSGKNIFYWLSLVLFKFSIFIDAIIALIPSYADEVVKLYLKSKSSANFRKHNWRDITWMTEEEYRKTYLKREDS